MKLKIIKFINSNHNWRKILSSPPYSLKIRDDGKYTLLKYNQLFSDFKEPMVREARGLIIKRENNKYIPVCVPFFKFFAIGDPNAKKDLFKIYLKNKWFVTEKPDGSLIKLFYDGGFWHIATNGSIDAGKVAVTFPTKKVGNFRAMFLEASKNLIDYSRLDKRYTYMFELVGMENKIVVGYPEKEIFYLGRRNNKTLKETPYYKDRCIGIEKVKRPECHVYINIGAPKKNMEWLQKITNELNQDNSKHFEGFVISNKSLTTKLKIKSKSYMDLFYVRGNGVFTPKKILKLLLDEKDDDIVSSFPEFRPQFDNIRRLFCIWLEEVKKDLRYMDNHRWKDRRSFSEWANNTTCPSIVFSAYEKDYWEENWLEDRIKKISIDNLIKYIGVDEDV